NIVTRHVFHGQNRKAADHRLYSYQPSYQRQEQSIGGIVHTSVWKPPRISSIYIIPPAPRFHSNRELRRFWQYAVIKCGTQQNARNESQKLSPAGWSLRERCDIGLSPEGVSFREKANQSKRA